MKRADVEREIKSIGKKRGFMVKLVEGGSHTLVTFDGHVVTLMARHREINEQTARGSIRRAQTWEKPKS